MPIVQVEIVVQPEAPIPTDLAARLADALGALWTSPPQGTWVKVTPLDARLYAENGGGPLPEVAPIFVTVLKAHLPSVEQLREETRAIAAIVAACSSRDQTHVHVLFQPPAAGRIAFGGELLEAT
jgi:phenylpyruvate tautomerase PptA (4-oxalocrotonate tautomerase family)